MNNQTNERDFIDLLSSLFYRKKMFYLILLCSMSIGVYVNTYWNSEYNFTLETKTPTKDAYLGFSEYLGFINGISISDSSTQSINIEFNKSSRASADYSNLFPEKPLSTL